MTKPAFTSKPIVVTVDGTDFTFTPSVMDANNHTNEVTQTNKVAPAYQYLMRSVDPKQKEALKGYLDAVPGLVMELWATVAEAAKGGIVITLKNSESVLIA